MSTIYTTTALTADLTAGSMIESEQIDLQQRMRDARVLDAAAGVLKEAGSLLKKTAYAELSHLVKDFLDIDIVKIMLAGWRKYEELLDAGQHTRGTDERVLVDLAGRTLSLVQHPTVDVVLAEQTLTKIAFESRVDIDVVALVGVVRDGMLVELTNGSCDITVTLSCHGAELATAKRTIDPRLEVHLGDGIALTEPRSRAVGSPDLATPQ